jgi:hypothetical protein
VARALVVIVAALLVAGCGVFTAPSPTAGEIGDVVAGLVRRGATITTQVSGDAGCADQTLVGNAVRYDVRPSGEAATVSIYVLRWKSQQTFDATESAFVDCYTAYKQAHADQGISVYEDSPWRVYGPSWSQAFYAVVKQAVHEAAGASPPEEIQ